MILFICIFAGALLLLSFYFLFPLFRFWRRALGRFHENPRAEPLDADSLRRLAVGALHGEQNLFYTNSLTTGHELKIIRKLLLRWWGIGDREGALRTIRGLWEQGHRGHFPLVLSLVRSEGNLEEALEGLSPEEQRDILGFCENLREGLPGLMERPGISRRDCERGIAGWDISRAAMLARSCFDCGYLRADEAWEVLAEADERARREFRSWEELSRSILIGRTMWCGYEDTAHMVALAEELLGEEGSPWRRIPFWPEGETERSSEEEKN